jgi:glycosyltransferase involved in cell wall biosynthesis
MKTVLIVQNSIPHYRLPLYQYLSEFYRITIIHSGSPVPDGRLLCAQRIVEPVKIGPFLMQPGVLREVAGSHYDAIVVMLDLHWLSNVVSVLLPRRPGRLLFWGHLHGRRRLADRIRRGLVRLSDGMILYTSFEAERLRETGVPVRKIYVAENTVEVPNHCDGSSCRKDSFIYVGRTQGRKRLDLLLSAFARAIDRLPEEVHVNIVGDGKINERLLTLSHELGITERVRFHGSIHDAAVLRSLFHRAYAYVSPGHVGLGVLHAMAYGVPTVTFKQSDRYRHAPEFYNITHGVNGVLCETLRDFTDSMVRLSSDATYTRDLGFGAYQHYAGNRLMSQMAEGFRDAIEGRHARDRIGGTGAGVSW